MSDKPTAIELNGAMLNYLIEHDGLKAQAFKITGERTAGGKAALDEVIKEAGLKPGQEYMAEKVLIDRFMAAKNRVDGTHIDPGYLDYQNAFASNAVNGVKDQALKAFEEVNAKDNTLPPKEGLLAINRALKVMPEMRSGNRSMIEVQNSHYHEDLKDFDHMSVKEQHAMLEAWQKAMVSRDSTLATDNAKSINQDGNWGIHADKLLAQTDSEYAVIYAKNNPAPVKQEEKKEDLAAKKHGKGNHPGKSKEDEVAKETKPEPKHFQTGEDVTLSQLVTTGAGHTANASRTLKDGQKKIDGIKGGKTDTDVTAYNAEHSIKGAELTEESLKAMRKDFADKLGIDVNDKAAMSAAIAKAAERVNNGEDIAVVLAKPAEDKSVATKGTPDKSATLTPDQEREALKAKDLDIVMHNASDSDAFKSAVANLQRLGLDASDSRNKDKLLSDDQIHQDLQLALQNYKSKPVEAGSDDIKLSTAGVKLPGSPDFVKR